jgi:hypothetical protein
VLSTTADTLARDATDPAALLCLAEFWRLNGFDDFGGLSPRQDRSSLIGEPSEFPGQENSRAAIYDAVMADPRVSADDKAYALYRAIRCYAPSGISSCGGEDVAQEQRQAWFQQLKKDYRSSRWAESLQYYW